MMHKLIAISFIIDLCFSICATAPTTLFVHGIGGRGSNVNWYTTSEWPLIMPPVASFHFPDVGSKKGQIKRNVANIGQERDIATLKQELEKIYTVKKVILVGSSRGAITSLNFAATDPAAATMLAAIIAEGASYELVASLRHSLANSYLFSWLPKSFRTWLVNIIPDSIYNFIISRFMYREHKPNGIQIKHVLAQIDPHLPILLVHSQTDEFVPPESSRNIYQALIAAGHTKVHLLELPDGKHGKYNLGKSARLYLVTTHAFYKKYGLPHDPALAIEGESHLATTQPALSTKKGLQPE